MKLYSLCVWLHNESEGDILYIGYRLLYFKKEQPQRISWYLHVFLRISIITFKIYYMLTGWELVF